MRSKLTTLSVTAALLAAGAGSAAARPADMAAGPSLAPSHHVAAPSLGVQHRYLGSDATNAPSQPRSAAAPTVRLAPTTVAGDGIDWAGIGIGGGLAAALLLSAAGVSAMRRHPTVGAR
jgi:hypothetical protein